MSEYIEQAEQFLKDTGTTFEIVYQYTGPYFTGDKDKRDVYRFTLKNAKGEYSGTFGDSRNATEHRAWANDQSGKVPHPRKRNTPKTYTTDEMKERAQWRKYQPSAYDILACLEKYEPDTFDSWAREYGYDSQPLSEYPNVLKIWTACVEEYRGLVRIFTPEQMEQLREIQQCAH